MTFEQAVLISDGMCEDDQDAVLDRFKRIYRAFHSVRKAFICSVEEQLILLG
jgi:hypothetical protein